MVNVSSVASFLMNFFAKRINNFVGDFNMIYIGLVVSGIRLLIYSLVV